MYNYKEMTFEELGSLIQKKYGDSWNLHELTTNHFDDELVKAFINKMAQMS